MSNYSSDDLESLLSDIKSRESDFSRSLEFASPNTIYLETSYIIKNVFALRLDAPGEVAAAETAEVEFYFLTFAGIIDRLILNEIERSTSTEVDVHTFALSLFKILCQQVFTPDCMLLGLLAAFAVSKGVWLLALKFICTDSSKESILKVLKKIEGLFIDARHTQNLGKGEKTHKDQEFYFYISLLASSVTRKPRDNWESMGSLYNLIEVMFEVGSVDLLIRKDYYDLMPEPQKSELNSLLLLTVYWITSAVFACSSQCDKLPQNEYVIQDPKMLRDIQDKLISIHERLLKFENVGRLLMDDANIAKQYQIPSTSNGSGFMALFGLPNRSEDIRLLVCDRKDITMPVAAQNKGRILMLLISDLDISFNEIIFLKDFYTESKTSSVQLDFELIWLPIHSGPWTTSLEGKYTKLLQMMPWYTIDHQTFITEKTKLFIKNSWKFHKQPIVVVLNENGSTVCPNAIHLMHIWGSKAFPFTRQRERELWYTEARLNSLIVGFDTAMSSMFEAGKWVLLYGGNDTEWVGKFTNCVRKVSSDLDIPMEMVFVEKTSVLYSAMSENVSQINYIWYFWARLESLLISRYQTFATARDGTTDQIIQEVKKLLSYASVESWACLTTPSSDLMIHGLGDAMLQGFMEYKSWKQNIHSKEFIKYFKNHVEELGRQSLDRACCRIVLRTDNKDTIENLRCPDCMNSMEKKVMYGCCHVHDVLK